ncbi:DUF3000 family protein [Allosaccharopolyspora coralli]|uniref:DUF3000 family protein n=1 Tax=Allosaccharopolyspora coralli TaxID=2665642 RepID=A0A5Q3Q7U1_9PSEU|nr:DUF3000 family protein [Allosaccharopolyspora coralli]
MTDMAATPVVFQQAVATLRSADVRAEIDLSEVKAPKRLAPFSFAQAAEAEGPSGELVTARLVLLHDPDGEETWQSTLRLVVYLRAELDPELAADPLLPPVGWSWLTDALEDREATYTALGGTVTLTSSARFGAISGPPRSHDLELRGSWTPLDDGLEPHASAFHDLIVSAAGLPPEGVSIIPQRTAESARRD